MEPLKQPRLDGSCVLSTNTSWHINVHRVKNLHTHMKCEVKHNGDMGNNGAFMKWGIYI